MSRPAHIPAAVFDKTLKVTPFELPPPHTPEHDEWLLDEALIETFPASDPIAVSPNSPGADAHA
jgi:hypothetical protein